MARRAVSNTIDGALTEVAHGMQVLQRLRASRQVHAALVRAAGTDLSQQAVRVLLAVDDGASVAEVAGEARMDMGAVSRQLTSLEADGLIARTVSPDNGSVVLITMTRRGRTLADRLVSVRDGHLAAALQGWPSEDVETLGVLLQRLVRDLQDTPYPTSPNTGSSKGNR